MRTTADPLAAMTSAEVDPDAGYEGFIGWVLSLMETLGEVGVGIALLIETFFPPMPSEAVLPGAGFLAYDGRMNVIGAVIAATIGGLVGAWGWYAIGAALGRDRTRRIIDRLPLMDGEDFDKAESFFNRYGAIAVLGGRCIPLVRSFISIPAGIERMPLARFSLYTFVGSLVWNAIWIGLGFAFGPLIKPTLEQWSGIISNAVLVVIGLLIVWFVAVRLRRNARRRREGEARSQPEV
ncbi:DedA family protein [Pseudactinotalea suaedae]|jgi:membrane protein DedA with SNARE-associated domain|uniref:DedA family protein n=1 Tax=Pseudactinotalea suaedae TaxID=1524924 RepID=UPI001F4FECF0|nr:DedA family protein [Pseudactinotalea suaedae]